MALLLFVASLILSSSFSISIIALFLLRFCILELTYLLLCKEKVQNSIVNYFRQIYIYKLPGLSQKANYIDRAITPCRPSQRYIYIYIQVYIIPFLKKIASLYYSIYIYIYLY
jgi:hypothetical protein